MTYEQVVAELGGPLAARVAELTTAILQRGNEIASQRGILVADTKVEFGLAPGGVHAELADRAAPTDLANPDLMPADVVEATRATYVEAYEALTGATFE